MTGVGDRGTGVGSREYWSRMTAHNNTHKMRIEGRGEVKDCRACGLARQCVVVFGIFVFMFLFG